MIRTYLFTLGTLLMLDGLWLMSMTSTYRAELAPIIAANPRIGPIVAFYPLYAAAILVFTILPSRTVDAAFARGLLLGAAAYGTYDLTNRATIEHFSLFVTCLDLAWGTVLTATVASLIVWRRKA